MSIDGISSQATGPGPGQAPGRGAYPPLRLRGVDESGPASRSNAANPADRASPPGRAEPRDGYSFEAVYRLNLPRVPVTDAQLRLERMRDMVAGRVDVPIHFENPAPQAGRAANPYASAYMKFPTDPATLNERASDAHRDG